LSEKKKKNTNDAIITIHNNFMRWSTIVFLNVFFIFCNCNVIIIFNSNNKLFKIYCINK
jgi:hypothetical protein